MEHHHHHAHTHTHHHTKHTKYDTRAKCCPLAQVRSSCARASAAHAHIVSVHTPSCEALAAAFVDAESASSKKFPTPLRVAEQWAADGMHFVDPTNQELTARCVLVVDALNWCFWPDGELEYEHLAGGVKRAALRDPNLLSPERLSTADPAYARALLDWPRALPNEEERARLLRELGLALLHRFDGSAAAFVRAAGGSASRLVALVAEALPGFRDAAVDSEGRQVFFYKRAQIVAGDMWGAFGGRGLGAFEDIALVTTYPDYRVPQSLLAAGAIAYSDALLAKVRAGEEVRAGSEEEIAIRAATVMAVEAVRDAASRLLAEREGDAAPAVLATHVDWYLWRWGEERRADECLPPFHRCRTVFY